MRTRPPSTEAATDGREPTATEQAIRSITSDRQLLADFCFELIGDADGRVTSDDEASTRLCAYAHTHADDARLADVLEKVRWHVVAAAIAAAVAPSRTERPSRSAERAALLGALLGRAWSRLEHAATNDARDSRAPVAARVGTAASEATEELAGTAARLAEITASDLEIVGDGPTELLRQVERWLFDVATSGGQSECLSPQEVGIRDSAAEDVGDADCAVCESLVCLGCGSRELHEYRDTCQLVRATDVPGGGFETTAVDDEEVLDLTYECAACGEYLTEDTLVTLDTLKRTRNQTRSADR